MFSKVRNQPAREGRTDTATTKSVPSIISADLSITGDLVSQGEIQVDGTIEGDIECRSLVIGINGSVTGEVTADDVRIHGSVSGQVRAKSVYLASTAHMVGDIVHESLAIEPGAFMEGHCRRLQDVSASTANLRLANGEDGDKAKTADAKVTSGGKEPAKIAG